MSVVGVVLAGVLFQRGFGDYASSSVVHGIVLTAAWAGIFFLVFGGLFHALAGERAIAALPWKAAIYAFPTAVVDARRDKLRLFEIDDLERIDGDGSTVRLVFPGETFSFQASGDEAANAKRAIEEARGQGPASDPKVTAQRNPLAEPRISSPLAPTEPRKPTSPGWVRMRFFYAAVLAILVGPAIWFGRNKISDDRAFATAKAKNDVESYRAYLKNGVKHRDEVQKTLLPRAELKIAEKQNTVDAILAYQKAHPNSAIQKESDAALRTAMLAELDVAKKVGTLAALNDFVAKRPEHGLGPELKEAKHAVYQAALASFKTVATDKDPVLIAFFERLLAYAETHDNPKVEIRFKEQASTSLGRADKMVTKQPLFNGETSYPSKYFEPVSKFAPAEAELAKTVIDKLSSSFPKEILTFSVGPAIPTEGDNWPVATVPTLFIANRVEWTGAVQPSQRPRGIFVGLNYHFESQFTIPGDQKPFKNHAVIVKSVPLAVLNEFKKLSPAPGEPEKAVYEAMNKESFDAFAQRLVNAIYNKKPTK